MTAAPATLNATDRPPARRLAGRGMRALLLSEVRLFLRDPGSVFFALAFPAVVLIGVGFAIPGMDEPVTDPGPWQGEPTIFVMIPAVLAAAMATPALTTLPVSIASYREQGLLKRLSTTPMRPQGVLVVHVIIGVASFVVASLLALGLAALIFDVGGPQQLGTAVLTGVAGAAAMFGVGLLIAAVAPRGNAAQGFGMLVFFPMLFFAGLWTPGPVMPDAVAAVATWTPLGAASQAMTTAWFEQGFPLLQMLVMAGYVVVLYPLAAKLFRWS
ncbi:ABC transporter permease [Georgenia halophila]|uniref:Transport permease protein n=1 Tax=Georgenia halophila TaxID=620889 RepID=A0ABP8L837_9MICO